MPRWTYRGPPQSRGKAKVDRLLNQAREGNISLRAECGTALKVHVARLANDEDAEMTEHAEVGALLEAETAHDLRVLRLLVQKATGAS